MFCVLCLVCGELFFNIHLCIWVSGNYLESEVRLCVVHRGVSEFVQLLQGLKSVDCLNSTTTIIVLTIVIVSGNRVFREWKEKMDYGRCVRGRQSIMM